MKYDKFLSMSNFFFLVTDAQSLKWLVTMKTSSKLFLRWSTQIFSYNFKILHRKGSIHLNADVLSRESQLLDNPTQQDAEETHIHKIFPTIKTCKMDICGICSISGITSCRKLNPKKFDILQTVSLNQLHA